MIKKYVKSAGFGTSVSLTFITNFYNMSFDIKDLRVKFELHLVPIFSSELLIILYAA